VVASPSFRRDYTASTVLGVLGMSMVLTGCGLVIWSRQSVRRSTEEGQRTATRMARSDEARGAEEAGWATGAELYELNDAAKAARAHTKDVESLD
jgi:hypothetical protein